MSTPLYQLKAEFFKTLGHPARIRVLERLSEREYAVAEMLPEVGIEPAHLSQQPAVLRRASLVTSRKEGSSVRRHGRGAACGVHQLAGRGTEPVAGDRALLCQAGPRISRASA